MSHGRRPEGFEGKITIICTEEQENYIQECGCIAFNDDGYIAFNDDVCDVNFCGSCPYDSDNIEFKRKENE